MDSRRLRSFVEILGSVVLVVVAIGCTLVLDGPRPESSPAKNLTVRSSHRVDPIARRKARAIAAKVASVARHSERAERHDLVKDHTVVRATTDGHAIVEQLGEASWYGAWHHGRPTAGGAPFDQRALTAAHPALPLGSKARVTNLATGRSVEVLINDRGPYVYGRDIDLSRAAAQAIGVLRAGSAAVRIEVVVDADPVPPRVS